MVKKADKINALIKYFNYIFTSRHYKGYGIHSPAVFEFADMVLFCRKEFPEYKAIGNQLKNLRKNKSSIIINEFGAGSATLSKDSGKISDIAKKSSVSPKFGRLLFRMAAYYKPLSILELGTSVGVSTLYLSKGAGSNSSIYTVEANQQAITFAQKWLTEMNCKNISFINSEFDNVLPDLINQIKSPTLVFIDGNHTYEATMRYFTMLKNSIKKGFIIIDDIYWSRDMEKAWKEIKKSGGTTIDIYYSGIVFMDEMITPKQYKIRF
jgi:predicted O-methyltransferase YrrM